MRNSIFQKRIPSIVGLLLVGIGIFASNWFLQTGVLFPTQATGGSTPQNVRISNVTDSSFTISYATKDAVIGGVAYGSGDELDLRSIDDRDTETGDPKEYLTHSITIKNLNPETSYSYKILSNGREYMKGKTPFTFTTPGKNEQNGSEFIISGKIQMPDDSGAIVYASLSDSQVVSTLVRSDGSFGINYSKLRSVDFKSSVEFGNNSLVNILISNPSGSSKISSMLGSSNPVPDVSLSQNYDFTLGGSPSTTPAATTSADISQFPSFSVDEPEDAQEVEIISPETNEGFSDQQPEFNGVALPNEEVEIIIHSDQVINTNVKASNKGAWKFRPDTPLTPGEHSITIRTRDSFGILKEIKKSFVVYAEGSQFTEPSVSPVRSPSPSKTPTPTIRPTNTPVPTTGVSITPAISLTPIPSAVISLSPTPEPTLVVMIPSSPPSQTPPDAGSPAVIISGLVGVVTLSVGLFVLFMSKGGFL